MATSLTRLEAWFRDELPRLNRAVLHDGEPPTVVVDGLATVLPELPVPSSLTTREAQRLVVVLGLAGSSVARHHQESDPRHKQHPEGSFAGLTAGPGALPFRDYFGALATGLGHYGRDAYASLVLWNVPTTTVRYRGETLATMPGVGADRHIHSYTGDPAEQWFFEFVKRGQTIELAVNDLLEPMMDGGVPLASAEGLHRVRLATILLESLRRVFLEFATPTQGDGMAPRYFMDVFRQFAMHWSVGDIPPSGALDVDSLKRDFLLGTVNDDYLQHVERLMPALLTPERSGLLRLMHRPSLPSRLLHEAGLDPAAVAHLSAGQIDAHPALPDWYRLLSAHARAAGGHLMLTKRFLFNPQRHRDAVGIGDTGLVSNRRGTTGMDESILERLARMRRNHELAGLRRKPDPTPRLRLTEVDLISESGLFTDGPTAAVIIPPGQRRRRRRMRPGRSLLVRRVIGT